METNKIYCGDNLQIMKELPENSVDLIYLDPPFFSQKHYEQIWGDKAEVRSFEDRWSGGITHYTEWMVDRFKEMHRILKPTGSIYLHCDWHASHYLKCAMDDIFGITKFQDEIIWSFSKVGGTTKKYLKWHETIFRYSKSDDFTFNMDSVREPYSESLMNSIKKDEGGLYYTRGLGTDNSIKRIKKTYINPSGKVPGDVWNICQYAPSASERLGYPTQKPEALLERIIKASSNEGDIVFDPFCGCGTTVSVAKRLNRKFIGIDISPIACRLIAKRVNYREFDIIGLPMTTDDLSKMSHNEFQQWVCDKMMAKNTSPNPHQHSGGDGGIDGIIQSNLFTGKYAGSPIQVTQSESVGVNKIRNFYAVITTDMKKSKGFIIALSFGSGAVEQVAKYKKDHNVDIKLIKAEDLCNIQHYDYGVKVVNSEDI